MTTVLIKGLGLIGSSLARIIKQGHSDVTVWAIDPNQDNIAFARQQGFIDQAITDWQAASQADFIFLATPVSQIIEDIHQLAQLSLKSSVVVTDVGSTKQTIMDAAQELTAKGIDFVGGHPMAGSHLTGAQAGQVDLFKDAFYFLISTIKGDDTQRLQSLLSAAQVIWTPISAADHDKLVAQISHLPHILAYTLVYQTAHTLAGHHPGIQAAAGGFKSTTRIAQADPTMWTAIMQNNQTDILQQLDEYLADLQMVRDAIDKGDLATLKNLFSEAAMVRQSLNRGEIACK
uniref:Prephenate dehydrogenase n=1 Tax=Lactiplantibacillus paraplantarum TaxID=60520 RepID=E3W9R3_9LACO|nr:prephenate dehydrogenase [Lactiplantibacillus paraplantarum]